MRRIALAAAAVLVLIGAPGAAQMRDHMMHDHKMHDQMAMTGDERQPLDFPPMARAHLMSNMRSHFLALQAILSALAKGDGAAAAKIARDKLGVESENAAACVRPKEGMSDMAAMMAHHMPDEMRALGLAMHEQASAFADVAEKTAPGGDLKPALAALAQVTTNCAACHAAYKLR
ncbi:MAG TPA: hypothetical protein VEH76_13600 [Methylocystis sp.]|nr:hypothetical protein [Methylocystis sp.]